MPSSFINSKEMTPVSSSFSIRLSIVTYVELEVHCGQCSSEMLAASSDYSLVKEVTYSKKKAFS